MKELHIEFKELKKKIFYSGNTKDMFVILDDKHPDTIRYNQLLGYFYPYFRTKNWINPQN